MKHFRDKVGRFSNRPHKVDKAKAFIIFGLGLLIALGICLADLTAQKVAEALYPLPNVPKQVEVVEVPELTIKEHICAATDGENCEVLINLAKCESALNPDAYHVNNNKTVDLGILQINSVHYTKDNMSAVCALDVYCAARWSNEQIKKGNGHIWVCWDKI